MKYGVLLFFSLWTLLSAAQTKIIAHKSHSGAQQNFTAAGPDNFGLDMRMYRWRRKTVQITKLNDTLYVFKNKVENLMYQARDSFEFDTVYSHQFVENPGLNVDSVLRFNPEVELIGFDVDRNPVYDTLNAPKKEALPITGVPSGGSSGGNTWYLLVAGLVAIAIGFSTWRQYQHPATS